MNEFIEQFLIESRELAEQASADLLTLEEKPDDRDCLASAFRGFHTLKGAAGIMGYEPMVRTLHAAEDVLAQAGQGGAAARFDRVSDCLATLDQVRRWLDAVEADGDLPADAEAEAQRLLRRFGGGATEPARAAPAGDWASVLLARWPQAATRARHALRLTPHPDACFEGRDPLNAALGLEGLLALEIVPTGALPALASLDPFACATAFELLLETDPAPVAERWRAAGDTVELARLQQTAAAHGTTLPERCAELLRAQILMLRASGADGRVGRFGSAVRTAAQALRRSGAGEAARRLETLAAAAGPQEVERLATILEQILQGALPPDAPAAEAAAPDGDSEGGVVRSIRVDVARLDALVNLAGELLVAKNALGLGVRAAQAEGSATAPRLRAQHAQLERLVGELQQAASGLRVLPMRQVFQRFPRIVRELVASLGKPARLVTEGDATEADKTIVEGLFEPILHLVRNALDHGVETAAERAAAGKPPSATLRLSAVREGDRVVITVEDDGRGLDLARIRQVAVERGVMDARAAQALDDAAAAQLVFAPGFSTAGQVSDISGRGVGMDAVRAAIIRLGGEVELSSVPGRGTTVRASLPFAVALTRVLTVEAGGQMFGIPLDAVLQTLRLPAGTIQSIGAARAFVLRDRTLPLIDLASLLEGAETPPRSDAGLPVVVAQVQGQAFGLAVGALGERLEVMLKPMEGLLARAPAIAGTTLMGDGRVLLVLDLAALVG